MKIVMGDGRVFEGTPLQIIHGMRAIAFGVQDFTIREYVGWVVANARKHEEVELQAFGDTDDDLAASLINEMLRTGLTERR